MKKILFATSEAVPFIKTGGLADVAGSLPKFFDKEKYDVRVKAVGGGIVAQCGAIRHGISRALVKANEEYKNVLRLEGLLTRDPRVKERKKYGRKRARKRFQFSKR